MEKKALLVIDMQNMCVGKNHASYFKYDVNALVKEVNRVIDANKDNVVIYIKTLMKKNLISKLAPVKAYEGTEEVELAKELHIVSNHVFDKYTGNALTNPLLTAFLKEQKIEAVEVVGLDGGGCVAKTAIGASKEGYKVIVNQTAIGTMFEKKRDKYFKQLKEAGAQFIE